ncbi:TIGR02452 family protein [Kingella oralis]|uniref:TIGR02452 family protein n=1 Tax=Kingella oralis TaxID=505 RepID=UPI002D7F2A52|nr:TIGR02452 family protein [Kingella oralis]
MNNKTLAQQALTISQTGKLPLPDGGCLDFSAEQQAAQRHTVLYRPSELAHWRETLRQPETERNHRATQISVTPESTQQAAYRLMVKEGLGDVVLLNFASAKNAGGGFLNGAKAQEEDLCRSSGLYLCQLEQPDYYAANRAEKSMLYTDHILYSPRVPFFRVSGDGLLGACFYPSVIIAPAPNAGVFLQREPHGAAALAAALQRRADYVLAVAKHQAQKNLVLGAWGCGVFRNPPEQVAAAFAQSLRQPEFADCFERIVFAIYDRSPSKAVFKAFAAQFQAA